MSNLRIIVTGLIGQYPLGGVTWDYIQYALGLKLMGHDVYYFEDTGQWPYNTPARHGNGSQKRYPCARSGPYRRRCQKIMRQSRTIGWDTAFISDTLRDEDLQRAAGLLSIKRGSNTRSACTPECHEDTFQPARGFSGGTGKTG